MPNVLTFVQQPDYVGFRSAGLPLQALGVIYDGIDPYATPLGVVFVVRERGGVREIYLPRASHAENGQVIYTHDLREARYVVGRNGFEQAQLHVGDAPVSDEAKNLLRAFLGEQNMKTIDGKYVIEVNG